MIEDSTISTESGKKYCCWVSVYVLVSIRTIERMITEEREQDWTNAVLPNEVNVCMYVFVHNFVSSKAV